MSEKKIWSEDPRYHELITQTNNLVKNASVEILIQGRKGYANYMTNLVKQKLGHKFTDNCFVEFNKMICNMIIQRYGHEI